MTIALSDLLKAKTPDEIVTLLLAEFTSRGFPVTDWLSGGVARTMMEAFAEVLSDLSKTQVEIAKGGFLEESTDAWLTLLARSNFNTPRKEATFALASVTLSDTGGGGPYLIAPGQLWAKSSGGLLYNNITGGTLVLSGVLVLTFKAESPGSAYNVPANDINQLATPLPGVVISASVISETAADEESDEQLQERASLQWADLAVGATEQTYQKWALDADVDIRRVKVEENTPNPGQIRITIARQDGVATGGDVATVQAYIDGKRPLCVDPIVNGAFGTVVNVAATVTLKSSFSAEFAANVNTKLTELFRTLEIGDNLFLAQLIDTLMDVVSDETATKNVVMTSPVADVGIGATGVAVLGTVNITLNLI